VRQAAQAVPIQQVGKSPLSVGDGSPVFRILDANLNRLREALRVIEEHFRFAVQQPKLSAELKALRHSLEDMEGQIGRPNLLAARDTGADPLAGRTRPEEMQRGTESDVLTANFKRAQEAARVIEEYAKPRHPSAARQAKEVRFALYGIEKQLMENKAGE